MHICICIHILGGGTRFVNLNKTVPAIKGNAVLWPSVMNTDPEEVHHRLVPYLDPCTMYGPL